MKLIEKYIRNLKMGRCGLFFVGTVMLGIGIWAMTITNRNTLGTIAACAVVALGIGSYCLAIFLVRHLLNKAINEKK